MWETKARGSSMCGVTRQTTSKDGRKFNFKMSRKRRKASFPAPLNGCRSYVKLILSVQGLPGGRSLKGHGSWVTSAGETDWQFVANKCVFSGILLAEVRRWTSQNEQRLRTTKTTHSIEPNIANFLDITDVIQHCMHLLPICEQNWSITRWIWMEC